MTHLKVRFFDGSTITLDGVKSVSYMTEEKVTFHDGLDGSGTTVAAFQSSSIIGWWYVKYEVMADL